MLADTSLVAAATWLTFSAICCVEAPCCSTAAEIAVATTSTSPMVLPIC